MTEHTANSVNPSVVVDEEEGLPSPPMDEGEQWATQTTNIQLSEFFDGIDEDGNLMSSGSFNLVTHENYGQVRRQEQPMQENLQGAIHKPLKPCNADFVSIPPMKIPSSHFSRIQRKASDPSREKSKLSGEVSDIMRMENAKRKLQEAYRQAEHAKRQRKIQIVELHDLPRKPNMKPMSKSSSRANVRH